MAARDNSENEEDVSLNRAENVLMKLLNKGLDMPFCNVHIPSSAMKKANQDMAAACPVSYLRPVMKTGPKTGFSGFKTLEWLERKVENLRPMGDKISQAARRCKQ